MLEDESVTNRYACGAAEAVVLTQSGGSSPDCRPGSRGNGGRDYRPWSEDLR